ncbi:MULTISPECIES: type II-A CRISPR-associated protein Csn2 [Lactococcus]|uniref:type II-A CRISPR-associated protein Csn2 n=1 Tax=Lactococcus TaxID=1357 RepID=UPI00203E97CB|nr:MULTISPECIES: type II-A CRISPR-associated protein Csn2 [Lactococcus]
MNINFPILDAPVQLLKNQANQLVVKSVDIYGQLAYAIYQMDKGLDPDYRFLLFNDDFKSLKNVTVVQHPLLFDLDNLTIKKMLFKRIIDTLDMNEKTVIEATYGQTVEYFNRQIFEDLDIELDISYNYKVEELFKFLKIRIKDETSSIFERTQLILNVLKEFNHQGLIIFYGLGQLMPALDYQLIIETANLNQQTVLFLDSEEVEELKNLKRVVVDEDYFVVENVI